MKNDGLSYTLDSFNFWRLNISYTDSALLFYLFHLFGFCTSNFCHLSFSQCTSGNLKLVPLGDEAFVNFHFDFAVGPVDLCALFQC